MELNNTFKKYYDYMQEVTPKLIEAETTVDNIKHSKEWKMAYAYFQTLYNRGQLLERPTQKNGYKILLGNNIIKLSEIEDILTEEQLIQIQERLKKE